MTACFQLLWRCRIADDRQNELCTGVHLMNIHMDCFVIKMTYFVTITSQTFRNSSVTSFGFRNMTNVTMIDNKHGTCEDWKDAQHLLFQLANLCLILSFLTPSNILYHAFCLRTILGLGYLFFTLWSGLIVCMPDVLGWNLGFFFLNMFHVIILGYKMLPARFTQELDEVYEKVFKPLRITRKEFRDLAHFGNVHVIKKYSMYAKEGSTVCGQKTSILLKGRLKVQFKDSFLHYVEKNEFIDSPEFDMMNKLSMSEQKYQVSIMATEDSLLITWPYPELCNHLESNEPLSALFHQMIGKDISNKLYQIQEKLHNELDCTGSLSRNSSLANLRSALASHSSIDSLNKFNCFGIHLKESMQKQKVSHLQMADVINVAHVSTDKMPRMYHLAINDLIFNER